MHSAFITTELRYPAVPLTRQLEHKRFVHPGPLVLRTGPLKSPTPTPDRDRTVSRRPEPISRTSLIVESTSQFISLVLVCPTRLIVLPKHLTLDLTDSSTRL